ncbi:actin bundler [Wolbachia endosymbiont (group A) of Ophion ellenae]|uniref:actin bundler n=1 Tax=Wolbachia endosymbiont (group A) of Ophion ellenae TaxID=3066210 RepID=UPI0030D5B871
MLPNKKSLNSVETEIGLQQEGSLDLNKTMQNLSNSDIANDHKKLKERMTDLLKGDTEFSKMKQGDKILVVSTASGLFTAVLPLLAVGATLAIPGAIVGLALYFAVKVAVKAVQSGYKGLKWSAEKTVDGAKYTAGKVKDASTYAAGKVRDGAMHVKDKVKEGYEHSVDSLKKGASFVGEGVANKFHKASGETDYLDKVKRFTPDAIKKSDEIRNDMKAIFADKGNNSGLVKNILSGISSEIDLKMAEKAKSGEIEHTSGWQIQKEFINNLNEKSLHNLLTQRSLPKGSYFIDSVFSEHHDEIKKVIKECRENHLYSSVSNMFDRAEKKANRPSVKSLTRSVSSSFSSLGRKGSEQSNSLSKSNSLNSMGTESTATVSDSDSQNFATVRRSNSSSSLTPKLTPVAPPELPRSASLTNLNGQSSFSEDVLSDPIVEQNLDSLSNRTLTHSNSTDSGMGSGSSTLTRKQVLPLKEEFDRELEEKLAKRRASLDQPSAEPVNSRATATPGTV